MNKLTLQADQGNQQITRHIYGHFAEHLGRCVYDGIWVGEDSPIPNVHGMRTDILDALKAVQIPVLRWPGGCYADWYHWKDGVGPRDQRPVRLNFWGDVLDHNSFGTHEFMDLCELLGAEPYICGNVGSGTPFELQQWIEYMTYPGGSEMSELRKANGRAEPWKVSYWGVGNENWGCGGTMETSTYAALYRTFQTFLRGYGENKLYKIAGGTGGVDTDGTSADQLLTAIKSRHGSFFADAISVHYYAYFREKMEYSSTEFGEDQWFDILQSALGIGPVLQKHREVMDKHDPERKVGLIVDEWGAWYPADPVAPAYELYQQNTMRDAIFAGLTLHIFHEYADRVVMANLAQTVNVLQALILTRGEEMILTPTYHVFEMFKGHQDAILLPIQLETESVTKNDQAIPAISASASRGADGKILLTVCNLHPSKQIDLSCELAGVSTATISGRILVGDAITAHNTFENPERVTPQSFSGFTTQGDTLSLTLPPASVVALTI